MKDAMKDAMKGAAKGAAKGAVKDKDQGGHVLGVGVNQVILGGRVSGAPEQRELPSGDTVVQLRVVVPRSGPRARGGTVSTGAAKVDTIDVACWTKRLQRKAARLTSGELVTVRGALRRRFWRSPAGAASRYEVEATALDRGVVAPPEA
jgi:single-strand DNA-binding protein